MGLFLFSVDFEDVRLRMKDGENLPERLPQITEQLLGFLSKHKIQCTFFVVGDVAEKYPELIKIISSEGHEIACHSAAHTTLYKLTKEKFRKDLVKNIDSLKKAGADNIIGYRAPVFSITENTKWAYDVLNEFGFKYSSSVLPASNPLFGWKNFGALPKKIDNLWEIPMSVTSFATKKIPFAGGVYFRALPFSLIKKAFSEYKKKNLPVLGYFHPYDFDAHEKYFKFPEINNPIFNRLLFHNRKSTFSRLEKVITSGANIITYADFIKQLPLK